MPGVIKGNPKIMRCLLEKIVERAGFKPVHDGQYEEGQKFYTKVYRLELDGEFVNTWLRFRYDLRTGYADVSISWKDLAEFEKLTDDSWVALNEEEVCSQVL